MREKILAVMSEIAINSGTQLAAGLNDDTILLESGLDSLGFAALVARLEEELGYDPFAVSSEPFYPRTLGDFVTIYAQHSDR